MELTAADVWSRILEDARTALPEQAFRTWLAPTEAVAISKDQLIISTPNPFAVGWVEDKYAELSPPVPDPSAVKAGDAPALLLGNRDGQAVAPLAAPGVQNLAAPLGRHAGAEPVLVDALAVARTIRWLHRNPFGIDTKVVD